MTTDSFPTTHAERVQSTLLHHTDTTLAESYFALPTAVATNDVWSTKTAVLERPTHSAILSAIPTAPAPSPGTVPPHVAARPAAGRLAPFLANAPAPTVETTSSEFPSDSNDPFNDSGPSAVDQQLDRLDRTCPLQKSQDPSAVITICAMVLGLAICFTFLRRSWVHWSKLQRTDRDKHQASPVLGPKATHLSSPPIRRPSAASTSSQTSKRPSEATLILVSWILFTLDHVSLFSMFVALFWVCPQFNCWDKPPAQTPGCPVPELFFANQLFLSLGSAILVVTTLQRFVRVYSLLSRRRYMFLCACTALVVLALVGRLSAIGFWTHVRLTSFDKWAFDAPARKLAHQVNRISYLVFFLTLTGLALVALLLGLQFVLNVRASLARVGQHSPASPTNTASTKSSPFARQSIPTATDVDIPQKAHLRRRRIRHSRRLVIGWILVSIFLLCNFGFVGLVLKDQLPMPANLFNALLLLLVKLLLAAVSMAMSEVVKLATATDHQ